nr:hypothetical protein [uncultured archaeon]
MRDTLKRLRSRVDKIDSRISELLDCRADISRKIGKEKEKMNICIVDRKRERDISLNVAAKRKNKMFIKNCFVAIINESRKLQK